MPYNWNGWNNVERARVARRFRHHVRTRWNPRGRIHREGCAVPGCAVEVAEGHHIDYNLPFVVVWLCSTHHREVERGEVRIKKTWIHDYTSLIPTKRKLWVDTPF